LTGIWTLRYTICAHPSTLLIQAGYPSSRTSHFAFFFLASMPERSHPFPSRTRKLSSPGPMVLQGQPCGRVGRCRGFEGSLARVGLLLFSARGLPRTTDGPRLTSRAVFVFGRERIASGIRATRWLSDSMAERLDGCGTRAGRLEVVGERIVDRRDSSALRVARGASAERPRMSRDLRSKTTYGPPDSRSAKTRKSDTAHRTQQLEFAAKLRELNLLAGRLQGADDPDIEDPDGQSTGKTRKGKDRGRDDPSPVGSGRPPHRSEHAELPHSAPCRSGARGRRSPHRYRGQLQADVAARGLRPSVHRARQVQGWRRRRRDDRHHRAARRVASAFDRDTIAARAHGERQAVRRPAAAPAGRSI